MILCSSTEKWGGPEKKCVQQERFQLRKQSADKNWGKSWSLNVRMCRKQQRKQLQIVKTYLAMSGGCRWRHWAIKI